MEMGRHGGWEDGGMVGPAESDSIKIHTDAGHSSVTLLARPSDDEGKQRERAELE